MHNDRSVHQSTVVLCHGDKIDISGQVLRFAQPPRRNDGKEGATISTEQIGDYLVFDRKIGSGAFSVVHLALDTKVRGGLPLGVHRQLTPTSRTPQSLKQVACKKMLRTKMAGESVVNVQREVAILKDLSHVSPVGCCIRAESLLT